MNKLLRRFIIAIIVLMLIIVFIIPKKEIAESVDISGETELWISRNQKTKLNDLINRNKC